MPPTPAVVLVSPPNPSMLDPRIGPPLGLLYLAAWARAHGRDTSAWRVVDLNTACYPAGPGGPRGHGTHDFSVERCVAEVPPGADVYGVQAASMQMPGALDLAAALRLREPRALLVAGGSHASAAPEDLVDAYDAVVTQEGEHALLEVLDRWADGALRPGAGRGVVVRGRPVEPLDAAPFPARDMLDFSRYTRRIAGRPATNIVTSRGCPARCVFCQQDSLWGRGLRMQSSGRILAEVDDIHATTGIRHLLFLDDSLTARKRSDVYALCDGLLARGVLWRGWTRANLCARDGDGEMLAYMARSGCQALCIGVEAGTDRVLRALDKGTTVAQNRTAIERVRAAGMDARASIMVGAPGETWDDVEALVRFVEEARPDDWILSSFVPLPGTPAWDDPARFGLVLDREQARRDRYAHFYVVGGDEQTPVVHRYEDGTNAAEVQLRHDYVQEALLRLCPRDRRRVTVGDVDRSDAAVSA